MPEGFFAARSLLMRRRLSHWAMGIEVALLDRRAPGNQGDALFGKTILLALFVTLMGVRAPAQSSSPVVTMSVTLPGGRTHEMTAVESGLATVSLEDGTEYGFRPSIQDSMP